LWNAEKPLESGYVNFEKLQLSHEFLEEPNNFLSVKNLDHIYNSTNGAVLAARIGGYVYSENGHGISWQWNDNSTFDYHNWYFGMPVHFWPKYIQKSKK
jgi:hypothetical protein